MKVAYNFNKKIAGGFEYYASTGPITGFDPIGQQEQQFVPAIDLDLNPDWEFNFGVGVGVTHSTDHLLIKMILGRRFDFFGKKTTRSRSVHALTNSFLRTLQCLLHGTTA